MHEIATEIEINASPARVWSVLVDFSAYPDWNPFIRELVGMPHVGETLKVTISPGDGKKMTFRPKVSVAEPERELGWLGRLLIPGLFDGEHSFRIVALASNRVRLVHGERFSGLLVGLARTSLEGTRAGFEAMNRALKARAEAIES